MKRCRLLLAMLGATTLIGVVVGTASARTFSVSSQTFRTVFEPRERLEITGSFGTYRCALTLEGSLHARTIAKVASSLIGYISRSDMAECSSMGLLESRVLRETLPWHVRYRSFTGTLPNISTLAFSIIGFAMQIREGAFNLTCLGTSTAERPFVLTYEGRASGTMTTTCPGGMPLNVSFGGRGLVTGGILTLI
jgi:hypothetical protein